MLFSGQGGGYEAGEDGVGLVRAGLEFGVELGADEKGVVGDLDDFDEFLFGGDGADFQAGSLDLLAVGGVEFVAVAVTFADDFRAIEFVRLGSGEDVGIVGAETHGGAHVLDALLFFLEGDDGMRGIFVELGGVGVFQGADIAGEFDGGDLHAEADAEVG